MDLQQAPPDIDEMVKIYVVCPYTGARCSGVGLWVSILRFSSFPTADVNDPKVN
jgi:hypothetical protein